MKRCSNTGAVKAEMKRVWNLKALGFPSISNVCHLFIMATGGVECKFDFQLFIFPRKKYPWEIFTLPCLPACSVTGIIRIHFKPRLNSICQHAERLLRSSRLCEALDFPKASNGPHHQQKGNEKINDGDPALPTTRCLVLNCAWRHAAECCCPAAQVAKHFPWHFFHML